MVSLLQAIANWIEMSTFLIVIYLMLPMTKDAKAKREQLQKFLFAGFIKHEELETAI